MPVSWAINRKLKQLWQKYQNDQKEKPAEIQSSPIANPKGAAISYRVERLRQWVEEVRDVCHTEIEAGRIEDTPEFWSAVYKDILVRVKAQANFIIGTLAHHLMLTNGSVIREREAVEENQRELGRLVAEIEV